ncbi:glycosyltransferase [Cetobacterium somerae]|jgi:UDP-N-acetylglucosamine transferase subunit ALG13|uniref:glycosyltransferase n=1 Tax=Cetobacterium somerae TaxID=188913 RepID=UPI003D768ACF
MYEVWYVSCHGFGHITRCIAQVEKKLEKDLNYKCIIICGESQIKFTKLYLKNFLDRIILKITLTDIGLINLKNSLDIDKLSLEKTLETFIGSWNLLAQDEIDFLSNYDIGEIFCDISPIGILVSKTLQKKVNLISNFTWYQQYKYLNLNKFILEKYLELDDSIDNLYLYPLNLDFSYISPKIIPMDFICRKIDKEKIKLIKQTYGDSIFISCGKSAQLEKIVIKNFKGTVFTTTGVIVENIDGNVFELPIDVLDTQNYIGASNFVISKAGWGTVAECICNKTPMILLEREGVLEDTHTINELKKITNTKSIKLDQLTNLDYNSLKNKWS